MTPNGIAGDFGPKIEYNETWRGNQILVHQHQKS